MAPAAPYLAEELWNQTGHQGSVHAQSWPAWDPSLTRDDLMQIPVQVNGKVRAVLELPVGVDEAAVKLAARSHPKVQQHLEGRTVVKEVYVEGKIYSVLTTNNKSRSPGDADEF
jgi:leucyl-tRNA synthetase